MKEYISKHYVQLKDLAMKKLVFLALISLFLFSCNDKEQEQELKTKDITGVYRGSFSPEIQPIFAFFKQKDTKTFYMSTSLSPGMYSQDFSQVTEVELYDNDKIRGEFMVMNVMSTPAWRVGTIRGRISNDSIYGVFSAIRFIFTGSMMFPAHYDTIVNGRFCYKYDANLSSQYLPYFKPE